MRRRHVSRPLPNTPAEKPVEWRGSSRDDLRAFPEQTRREAGFQIGLMQLGYDPDDRKPMPQVGAGTLEIRVRAGREHRVFIVAKFKEALYILHAFEKKSRNTTDHDMSIARKRYRALIAERGQP